MSPRSWKILSAIGLGKPDPHAIVGSGNSVDHAGANLTGLEISITGDRNRVRIGQSSRINGLTMHITGNDNAIDIGEFCVFSQGGIIWIEDDRCKLTIGNETTIEHASIAVTETGSEVTIGRDCLISYDVDIRTGDSHSIMDDTTGERINYAEDVRIGDHAWIGAHCLILKGAVISSDSIVGSGSVVTSKFTDPGVVIAGSPARVVKSKVHWLRERLPRARFL